MIERLYFEDFDPGQKRRSARAITVTRERIIDFATEFDPHPGHTGEESAAASAFGALVASGWHTAGVVMRLITETTPIQGGGMGGGVELKWLRPVHPGDAIHIESEVISTRTSATRPQWGIAVTRTTGFNQKDQAVIEITSTVFLPRREAAAP